MLSPDFLFIQDKDHNSWKWALDLTSSYIIESHPFLNTKKRPQIDTDEVMLAYKAPEKSIKETPIYVKN